MSGSDLRHLLVLLTSLSVSMGTGQAHAADPDHRRNASVGAPRPSETLTSAVSSSKAPETPPCTSVALSETIGGAFTAFALKNEAAWQAARLALPPLLACQPEPLSADLSARVLHFQGLAAGGAKQVEGMSAYLRGAAAISNDYPFTDQMFPPGHYYARAWAAAVAAPVPEPVLLLGPDGLALQRRVQTLVNGEHTREILPGVYSVVQVSVAPRGVLLTVELDPSTEDPRLPPVPALQDALDEQARALKRRRGLLVVSGGAAVTALATEVASLAVRGSSPNGDLDLTGYRLQKSALVLTGACVGIFVVSWSVGR